MNEREAVIREGIAWAGHEQEPYWNAYRALDALLAELAGAREKADRLDRLETLKAYYSTEEAEREFVRLREQNEKLREALREFLDEFDVAEGRPAKYDLLRAALSEGEGG